MNMKQNVRNALIISGIISASYFVMGILALASTITNVILVVFFPIILTKIVCESGFLLVVLFFLQFSILWLILYGLTFLILKIRTQDQFSNHYISFSSLLTLELLHINYPPNIQIITNSISFAKITRLGKLQFIVIVMGFGWAYTMFADSGLEKFGCVNLSYLH